MADLWALVKVRLARAYGSWPSAGEWRAVGRLYLVFALSALPLALAAGLLSGREMWLGLADAWWIVPGALVWPSLIEETLFRVLLFPHPSEGVSRARRWGWGAVSLFAYVVSHPVNVLLFRPDARGVFDAPIFLLLATLLGTLNLLLYDRTGSAWPPVLAHWFTVATWLYFGGKALIRA